MPVSRVFHLALLLLPFAGLAKASPAVTAEWQGLLAREHIETIRISPNGAYLALAERVGAGTLVTIRTTRGLQPVMQFNPGDLGEVEVLKWLDDDRLVIGANRVDSRYRVALVAPALYIVSRDGRSKERLPANFLATIDGDPEHLLVTACRNWQKGGCIDEVQRVKIGHSKRVGDVVIAAPDTDSALMADRHGHVRFALSWSDSSQSRLHVHPGSGADWKLINDAAVSGIDSLPLGLDQDGKSAYLVSERKSGTSVVERYRIADGVREVIYEDSVSDPTWPFFSLDGTVPLGAYYSATRPKAVIWNSGHPDAAILRQIMTAFPGKFAFVTSATKDRNLAVVKVSSDKDPGSYYLFDRSAKTATLIAHAHADLASRRLPDTKEVVLQARDGTTLYGLLTLPPGKDPTALPMVVVPHGGPYEVVDTKTYDAETAILATQGFAVLRVNFRGSGGYGRAFVEKGHRQWGRAMQDDVTDATRWAIDQGIADRERICIYGASYGGYAALMGAVREPELYRCAAGYAAPYNLAKMYKWGSIRRSDLGLNYLERVLGKDKEDLAVRSPSRQAGSIKIPVLLAHGRLDARVAVQHSREMVKALRKTGVDVDLVEYPYEGHGLAIDKDRIDFYTRLLAFLDEHTRAR